jgi:hypothetical protein
MWHVWERREIAYRVLLFNLKETGPLEDVGKVGE